MYISKPTDGVEWPIGLCCARPRVAEVEGRGLRGLEQEMLR